MTDEMENMEYDRDFTFSAIVGALQKDEDEGPTSLT